VPPALNALSNYPLAILSSDSPATLKATVESARLQGAFAHVMSAEEVKIFRPSPWVYQLAPGKVGVDAASIA
jgi:2-haloacid dehalogenase